MKIGQKVILKPSYAKWHLNHPEIYTNGISWDKEYEEETLLHLVCCLGEPVYGKVLRYYSDTRTALVKFRVGNITVKYWVERHHVEKV